MNDDLDPSDSARRWRRVLVLATWFASLYASAWRSGGPINPFGLLAYFPFLPFFPAGLAVAFGYSGLEVGWGAIVFVWVGYGLLTWVVLSSRRSVASWSAWVLLAVLLVINVSGCHHGHFQ